MHRSTRRLRSVVVFSVLLAARIAWVSPTAAEVRAADLQDYSESGAALVFVDLAPGSIEIRLGDVGQEEIAFAVAGARGEHVSFRVPDPPPGLVPSYSYGDFAWTPIDDARQIAGRDGSSLVFSHRLQADRVVIRLRSRIEIARSALAPPTYTWPTWQAYMGGLTGEPNLTWSVIGSSIQGRDLYKIVIEDTTGSASGPTWADSSKKHVLILGRQHGDETMTNYILEGFIDYLVGRRTNQPKPDLFERMSFVFYPFVNPDGAVADQRQNAQGFDLNRQWLSEGCSPTQTQEIFVFQCDYEIEARSRVFRMGVDFHGWGSNPDGGFRFALGASPGNAPANYYQNQDGWFRLLESMDPWRLYSSWVQNGATTGMVRLELLQRYGLDMHTPETNEFTPRSATSLRDEGELYAKAIVAYLLERSFTDATGADLSTYTVGDDVYATVRDLDENTSSGSAQTIQATVTSPATGDHEMITLEETGNDTSVFRNTTGLPSSFLAAVPGNGVIETLDGATLQLIYFDDDFPFDHTGDSAAVSALEQASPRVLPAGRKRDPRGKRPFPRRRPER